MTQITSNNADDKSLTDATNLSSNNSPSSSIVTQHQTMQAVPVQERIAALDVVRGFALIGIFFMNIEFFNRSIHDLGKGIPQESTGIDWMASYFVQYFIAGKFWTMFSLLFGMGFALMLIRANEKDQEFLKPYIRRVIALAIFGACHFIFLWPGDILFSYAATAVMLLVILFGKVKWIAMAAAICGAIAFIPHLGFMGSFAAVLLMACVLISFIRYEKIVDIKLFKLPFLSMMYVCIGTVILIITSVMFFIPNMKQHVIPMLINGVVVLGFGLLMGKYHQPPEHRTLRAGIGLYSSMFIMMTAFGAYQYWTPKDSANEYKVSATRTSTTTTINDASGSVISEDTKVATKVTTKVDTKVETNSSVNTDAKTSTDKAALEKAEKEKKQKEEREKAKAKAIETKKNDIQTLTKGSYAQVVQMRVSDFVDHLGGSIGMAMSAIAMFLIGFWFVSIGIMKDTAKHLTLFKKMAIWGLPIGIGMGMLGGLVATGQVPNKEQDGYMFATGLQMLFNLPACMGYVGLLVWMLHSKWASVVKLLAPFGRMALTNYLSQSLIATTVFYGYGFGLWGMGRAHQLLFGSFILLLQIIFSHLWLKFFRYGPLEWVWRAITYWKIPAMLNAAH